MRSVRLSRSFLACVLLGLVVLTGCGESRVALEGKVNFPPSLKFADNDQFEVRFFSPESPTKGGAASGKAKDANFTVNNVPAGKYKVAVRVTPYPGEKGSESRAKLLEENLNKKYDAKSTPLTYDVTSDAKQSVTIDLTKNSVTKN